MTRAEAQALDDSRVSPWHTPRHPGPHADPEAVARWERARERQAQVLDGLAAVAEQRPSERPRWFAAELDRWRDPRPLMRPVGREARPLQAVDARQMGLFEGAGRREEAA